VPRHRALINRMGFNNAGAERVAANLRRATYRGIRGVSIGKNSDTPIEAAAADYLACLEQLYDVADYFAVNVSSPNTARLRELQSADSLGGIVGPLLEARARLAAQTRRHVPLFVKISPDLEADELDALCAALIALSVDGVIAINTSTRVPALQAELDAHQGGVSGAPVAARSVEVLRALRVRLGPRFPIINVGGIMSAQDALARLAAGANLVQVYTGFVYRGPALLAETLRALNAES
jgi:dihydroorotate dehydrogenase